VAGLVMALSLPDAGLYPSLPSVAPAHRLAGDRVWQMPFWLIILGGNLVFWPVARAAGNRS